MRWFRGSAFANEPRVVSLVLALALLLGSFPLLAPAPLSGDGWEMVHNVAKGGVLHPPGFPFQQLLHRLLGALPFGEPTLKLSLLSLAGHVLTVFFVAECCRACGASTPATVVATLFAACFPSVWPLGLEPEVFAITHAVLACIFWQCAVLWQPDRPPSHRDAVLLGALVGVAASQHPITVTAAPAFLGSFVAVCRGPNGKSRAVMSAAAFAIIACGFYWSLLAWGAPSSHWPHWHLKGLDDVVDHLLRRSYGTFRLGATTILERTTALEVLWTFLLSQPLQLMVVIGGYAIAIRRRTPAQLCFAATVTLALAFLEVASLPGVPAHRYLERFLGTFVIPAACLMPLCFDAAVTVLTPRARRLCATFAALFIATWSVGLGLMRSDLSERTEQEVFRRALGAQLPENAVWIAGTDREVLGGAVHHGRQRFPINSRPAPLWYWTEVVPRLEPRLPWPGRAMSPAEIVALARDNGLSVVSVSREELDSKGDGSVLRGLFWHSQENPDGDLDEGTVASALALCPFLEELRDLPGNAPGFGRGTFLTFARAFDAASVAPTTGSFEAEHFRRAARALERGEEKSEWSDACRHLLRPAQ